MVALSRKPQNYGAKNASAVRVVWASSLSHSAARFCLMRRLASVRK